MKKTLLICLGVLLVAGAANAAISGSSHDLQAFNTTRTDEICVYCHTPHNAKSNTIPLWNHLSSGETFSPYSSSTLNSTATVAGISLACMSCHDGATAVDAFGSFTTGSTIGNVNANFGTDLRDDHPVGVDYSAANEMNATSTAYGGQTIADYLFGSNLVECASCHDVHNGITANGYMLVESPDASALCLKCHNK